jgi:hypothetical protein
LIEIIRISESFTEIWKSDRGYYAIKTKIRLLGGGAWMPSIKCTCSLKKILKIGIFGEGRYFLRWHSQHSNQKLLTFDNAMG